MDRFLQDSIRRIVATAQGREPPVSRLGEQSTLREFKIASVAQNRVLIAARVAI
jgi:hypothetical protein